MGRKMDKKNKAKQTIYSNEKSGHWILMAVGFFFCLPFIFLASTIFQEVSVGEYGILFTLLFPLVGSALIFSSWKMRKSFLYFGPTPLIPSPLMGQVGGQIGGRIEINKPWQERNLDITLSCLHTYSTGSGDNSRSHTDIVWQAHDKPLDRANSSGSVLEFVFDVPANKPTEDTHNGRGSITWQVTVKGIIADQEFNRSWKIPTQVGSEHSSIIIPNTHKEAAHSAKLKQAESSIEQQIHTQETALGLDIVSDQGRNKSMSIMMTLFGAVFTAVGCFLFFQAVQGEAMLWLMAPIFFAVGALILCYGIFLLGRKLECKIIDDQVHTRRSFFGKVIYTRQGKLTSPDQLILKSTMTSTHNGIKTEYMGVYAKININGQNGSLKKEIKLVEGIEGRPAGEAMMRKLTDALIVNNNNLKGELEAL